MSIDFLKLIKRLNPLCRRTMESALGLCMSRSHYNLELEHWLGKLLEASGSNFLVAIKSFDIDLPRLEMDVQRAIDKLKTGNAKNPGWSEDVGDLVKEAWVLASIEHSLPAITSGHVLVALVSNDALARSAYAISKQFEKINAEALKKNLMQLTGDTPESQETYTSVPSGGDSTSPSPMPMAGSKTPALDQFTIDLTDRAKKGKIDPVLGRDPEIRQIVDILTRRRQNNPILTGEAGVGKTAVVEGFAIRIAIGDVPPSLRNVSVRTLDLGLLQAGAGVKGEFENRLKSVIDEVKSSPKPIILFIDEAHTLIGAGGSAGQGDAANLLKPALARGELRTIAATTWAEYKKYFEKDAALARRFQVVKVEEPEEAIAVEMIRGLTDTLEKHHRVRILDEAIIDAVKLSNRYISGRQLPDKAVSLIDTTCARIGISQSSKPPAIEDLERRLEQLRVSTEILHRESATGAKHDDRLAEIATEQASLREKLEVMKKRWEEECALVAEVQKLGDELEAKPTSPATGKDGEAASTTGQSAAVPLTEEQRKEKLQQLGAKRAELAKLQGDQPLVHAQVDRQAVAETVAAWTGIPVGRMVADEIRTVLNLKDHMERAIVGQTHALDRIAQSIRTSRAQLRDPRTPIGVFLLAGTSGVGKTETAITLAQLLYGGEQNMTTINMSEFKEEHKVSLLMGSPPGYVGYGEGGVLTEAVRRKPYSVVLLDEMEKAHSGVQDIFYQVFDKGNMKDGEGRDIDFKNTVILMTSNAGTNLIKKLCSDPNKLPDPDAFVQALFPELLKTFKPAFLGRVTIIPYYPLTDSVLKKIVELKLGKIGSRIRENYAASFDYAPELVQAIADRCTEVDTGARNVDHILTKSLLPELSEQFLGRMAEGQEIRSVRLAIGSDGAFQYAID